MAGGGVTQIADLQTKWDKFELMMQSFQLMVKEQIDVMKTNVESRVADFQKELEKFAARWHQLKPGNDVLESGDRARCQQAVSDIKQRKQEFNDLDETRAKLV